jgi:hypothetical protein
VLLACFAAVLSARAQSSPLLSSNRFLFIIDASSSMKPFDDALREAIFDLIYSGIRGRMTNGDTYGVWVVTDRNDTSFPMGTWRSRSGVEIGVKATAHVKERAFKGKPRLDLAMADALRVIKNVGDLTIVLVSNGETPVAGTPFDDAINACFRELAPQMKRAKKTLNTTLVARDGALVAWAANAPQFLIDVPNVPLTPKPAQTEVATAPTNAPAIASNVTVKVAPSPFKNALNPLLQSRGGAPIIITRETVAAEKREFAAMTSTVTNSEPGRASTNAVATASETNSIPSSVSHSNEVALAVASTNAVAPASPASAPAPNETRDPATNVAAVISSPQKPEVAKATGPLVQPAEMAGAAIPPGTEARPLSPIVWSLIGAGVALLCVLIGALVLVARSRRQESSLISQALAQGRTL